VDVWYLGLDDLLVIASAVLGIEAGVLANMANLVTADMAVNAPAASFGGEEFYPEFETKVGVLGYRLARHHALPDGNKRTAFLAMVEFVERNGRAWTSHSDDRTVEMMVAAAAGSISEQMFIRWVTEEIS
jgi:death-on-curing protein